jgi:hypothetical protein
MSLYIGRVTHVYIGRVTYVYVGWLGTTHLRGGKPGKLPFAAAFGNSGAGRQQENVSLATSVPPAT